jgi:outer membrane cobalamin receptor
VSWSRSAGGWVTSTRASYRNHGDHFRWDINRPGFAENRHRTNAVEGLFVASRAVTNGAAVSLGASGGGDWIASSNLGDHEFGRVAIFAEGSASLGGATVRGGLRVDQFSNFGSSANPTASVSVRLSDEFTVRSAVSRGFRVPSFTELYYHDPANLGNPDLQPEHGWTLDGGAEWERGPWSASVSPFRRWDHDVIDWVKDAPADLWRSTNVRDVTSTGFEAVVMRRWKDAFLRLHYAGLKVDAPALTQMSKYVLEYARHQAGGSLTLPIGAGFRAAVNVDHRDRLDGQEYDLVGVRISRGFKRGEVFVDVANALDESYTEVAGVVMPGRWVSIGFRLR